jgi:hypothetical protein
MSIRTRVILTALLVAAPTPVGAQPAATTAAEALFEQGRALMKAGDLARACEKFAASHQAEPSVGALLNLGDCREKNGQLATAWTRFRQAAAMASKAGEGKRERYALGRARKLAPRLSYLLVRVGEDARVPGLTLTRDGEPVGEALWGQAVPVDAGAHVIRAQAPGRVARDIDVQVRGEGARIEVSVPTLAPRGDRGDGDGAGDGGAGDSADDIGDVGDGDVVGDGDTVGDTEPDRPAGMPGRRKLALVIGAVGLAGLAAGGAFGVSARGKWNEAQDGHCDEDNLCDREGVALVDDAKQRGAIANIAFVAGGVTLAAALVLWLTARPQRGPTGERTANRAMTLAPIVGVDRVGLDVAVRF